MKMEKSLKQMKKLKNRVKLLISRWNTRPNIMNLKSLNLRLKESKIFLSDAVKRCNVISSNGSKWWSVRKKLKLNEEVNQLHPMVLVNIPLENNQIKILINNSRVQMLQISEELINEYKITWKSFTKQEMQSTAKLRGDDY